MCRQVGCPSCENFIQCLVACLTTIKAMLHDKTNSIPVNTNKMDIISIEYIYTYIHVICSPLYK